MSSLKKSMSELERKSIDEFKQSEKIPIVIVLDEVRSMNNVGSIFRTADSFLVEAIYLCGLTPTPPHRDIQKTALGATETVSWKHFSTTNDAIEVLKKEGYIIYSIEQAHQSILLHQMKIEANEKYAFVFGNEVNGVQDEIISLSNATIEIPQLGSKHSLNVSVSAGIVLWEAAKNYFS